MKLFKIEHVFDDLKDFVYVEVFATERIAALNKAMNLIPESRKKHWINEEIVSVTDIEDLKR